MDDDVKRAEELLEERMRGRRTNGQTAVNDDPVGHERDEGAGNKSRSDTQAETSRSDTEATLTHDLQRLAADFANYRKRTDAERLEFAKYAKADLIRKLLDVLDGYDRALETMPEEIKGQPWVEGMWLVERKLRALLEAEGLQALEAVGTPFDPYVHEAVAHVPSADLEGTVVSEYQKGYRLHDRLIRPALVTVSSGPAADLSDEGAAGKSRSDTEAAAGKSRSDTKAAAGKSRSDT